MGGVRNARMIKAQVCCSMGCKWCMAYAYILVCNVIPRASPSELHKHPRMYTHGCHTPRQPMLQHILVLYYFSSQSVILPHCTAEWSDVWYVCA